jgi:DNA-binding CsgD family transcriptional regulator
LIISWLDLVLVIPIIYFIYQAVNIVKNSQEHVEKQKIVTQALSLVGVFIPGILADLAWVQLKLIESIMPTGLYFSSLFFLTFNCFIMFGGIKYLTQPIHSKQYFRQQCSKYKLTEREEDICSLLLNGQSNSAISDQLFIELSTVKKHIQNIFKKTNTSQRFELTQKLRGVDV